MSNISTWFDTAAGNNVLVPPDGAPENGTNISDFNNIVREMQASVRRGANERGWFEYGDGSGPYAAAFLTGSSFQIQGVDVTTVYTANTRVRITQGVTVLVGIISSSAFTAGDTDVLVVLETGVISNASIDSVEIGLAATPSPVPVATLIRDTDRDTSVSVEESPDDDAIVATAAGQQVARSTTQGTIQPLQPSFSYYADVEQSNVTGAGARYLVPFPAKNFERGSMMNASFDTLTAVLPGIYLIDVMLTLQNFNEQVTSLNFDIERSDGTIWRWGLKPGLIDTNATDYPLSQSRKIEMAAGQTLQVELQISGLVGNSIDIIGSTDRNRTEFSAWLLG